MRYKSITLCFIMLFYPLTCMKCHSFVVRTTVVNRLTNRAFSAAPGGSPQPVTPPMKEWDLKSLNLELVRQTGRTFKKIVKAEARLLDQNSTVKNNIDQDTTISLSDLKQRLTVFREIESRLKNITKSDNDEFKSILATLIELGVDKYAPPDPIKIIKPKAPPVEPRKPYNTFTSSDDIPIWVGRKASDNDILSCDPAYRDNAEWWMHVSGCAGSHVVIKSTDNDLISKYHETVMDAAVLTAHHSKAVNGGKITVTLTRCRNVSKPKGYVAGMVLLNGKEMHKVLVNLRNEQARLQRLQGKSDLPSNS